MRNVIFVAPYPLDTTYRFVRAVARLEGVRLLGIVAELPRVGADGLFADVARVDRPLDADTLIEAARALARRHGPIARVVGILEPLQVQLAQVRAALGVPGTTPEVADRFRDKGRMKDELRRHGLPCARHRLLTSMRDAEEFVAEVGFPIVVKPTAGMGCRSTWRVSSAQELGEAVAASHVSAANPAIAEEFLRGREYSFETITVGGEVRFTSISRYLPTPLEVVENDWIQWCVLHPRDITGPEFDDARELGVRAVKALGLETGFTHMEWFRRDDGTLAIGEIAARPPGAEIVSCNNYVHDADLHRAWARAVVDEAFDGPWERRYSVGAAFLRGMGRGRVARVRGVAEANARVNALVVESRLPRPGAPKSESYEGDGVVIVRHPDTAMVERALQSIIGTIRVEYA
jgi:biotin carboxylase